MLSREPPTLKLMWQKAIRPFKLFIIIKRTIQMDASVSQRLSNLSKRQLLDALNAITNNEQCTNQANSVLKEFLDALPVVRGSSRTTIDGVIPVEKVGGKEEAQSAHAAFSLSKLAPISHSNWFVKHYLTASYVLP